MEQATLVGNERLKLVASFLSNLGVAAAAGGFVPTLFRAPDPAYPWAQTIYIIVGFVFGGLLCLLGCITLSGLRAAGRS